MPWASLIPPACASLIQTVGIAGTVAFEQAVAFEFAQIVTELVQPVGMRGKLKRGEDGFANLLARVGADPHRRYVHRSARWILFGYARNSSTTPHKPSAPRFRPLTLSLPDRMGIHHMVDGLLRPQER